MLAMLKNESTQNSTRYRENEVALKNISNTTEAVKATLKPYLFISIIPYGVIRNAFPKYQYIVPPFFVAKILLRAQYESAAKEAIHGYIPENFSFIATEVMIASVGLAIGSLGRKETDCIHMLICITECIFRYDIAKSIYTTIDKEHGIQSIKEVAYGSAEIVYNVGVSAGAITAYNKISNFISANFYDLLGIAVAAMGHFVLIDHRKIEYDMLSHHAPNYVLSYNVPTEIIYKVFLYVPQAYSAALTPYKICYCVLTHLAAIAISESVEYLVEGIIKPNLSEDAMSALASYIDLSGEASLNQFDDTTS